MAQRLKGQETTIFVMKDGVNVTTLTDIRNFTMTPNFDKLEEGYLGETTQRYDEIFKGCNFDFECHLEEAGFTDFIVAVKERATRRTPGTVINISCSLSFANGQRRRIILRDCFFADIPFNVGSRSDYASIKLSGSASDFDTI